jgi:hypothetical protein
VSLLVSPIDSLSACLTQESTRRIKLLRTLRHDSRLVSHSLSSYMIYPVRLGNSVLRATSANTDIITPVENKARSLTTRLQHSSRLRMVADSSCARQRSASLRSNVGLEVRQGSFRCASTVSRRACQRSRGAGKPRYMRCPCWQMVSGFFQNKPDTSRCIWNIRTDAPRSTSKYRSHNT